MRFVPVIAASILLGPAAVLFHAHSAGQPPGRGGRNQEPGPTINVRGHTFTQLSLFQRNVGGPDDMTTPFPPHKVIGNIYYVGTNESGRVPDRDAAGKYPDQQHVRAERAGHSAVGRAARLQVLRHQDSARQPCAWRSSGRRRGGEAVDRRAGDGDGRGRAGAAGDEAGRQGASDRPGAARRRNGRRWAGRRWSRT